MDYTLLAGALLVLVVILVFIKVKQDKKPTAIKSKNSPSNIKQKDNSANQTAQSDQSDDWTSSASQSAEDDDSQDWEWDSGNLDASATSVSAQEVDPLTEYQVYKQFSYEDKAAASLAGYLNNLKTPAPEKLVHELAGLSLRTHDIDLLSATLDRHANVLSLDSLAEYIRAGLGVDANHLGLRVLAESRLNWGMQEVAHQIGEKTGLDDSDTESGHATPTLQITMGTEGTRVKRIGKSLPLIVGRGRSDVPDMTEEEMGAVLGFVKPEKSTKLLKNQLDYETALQQYNRAIQKSAKPAGLIIDALKLDYQHAQINEFAAHLWKLYYSLGQHGRQVKERMLGWGYSLGQHEMFDKLERSPSEQKIREIGLAKGYLQPTTRQIKAKYRELVQRDDSILNQSSSPAEVALKEVESLLMYGQLEQAIATLEQSVLQYPQESQLYIMLFDLYERSEDWSRLEQFLRLLRDRESSLPEEVVLAMSQLLQRVNRSSI